MGNPDIVAMALDAMVAINAAIRNTRLYPAGSAMVKTSIARVLPPLNAVIEQQGTLSFAESEKALLIFNDPLPEKELKKPQSAAFLELFLDFGIRDITFKHGVTVGELETLFTLLSQKPEDISAQGGLQRLVAGTALPHIALDHKVYVALAKDQVVAKADQVEGQTADARGAAGGEGRGGDDPADWRTAPAQSIAEAVKGGIASLTDQGDGAPGNGPAEALAQLVSMLDGHGDGQAEKALGKDVATALAGMDPDALARILAQDPGGVSASSVLAEMAGLLDDAAFVSVAAGIRASGPSGAPPATYDALMGTGRGQQLQARVDDAALAARKARTAHVKSGIQQIMSGDIAPLADPALATALPRTVAQLMAKNKTNTAVTMMERLQQGLRSNDPRTRMAAAGMMVETGVGLIRQGHGDAARGLAVDLSQWIKSESAIMPALEDVYAKLQRMAKILLQQGAYGQANRYLEPLNRIKRGDIPKDPSVQAICESALRDIADAETLEPLLEGCMDEQGTCAPEAVTSLKLLCPYTAAFMLDILAETRDRSRRAQILRLYPELGEYGVAELGERLSGGGPWFFLRNLASMMGKMGGPAHVDYLVPLLHNEEIRVQREAMNAIYTIGGSQRGSILTRYLSEASDPMKATVAALLGALKHRPAIRPLMALLDSKASLSAKFKDPVQIKVCQALGALGATEAVPVLTAIVKERGVLLRSHSVEVQRAAKRALSEIKKAQAEAKAAQAAAPAAPPAAPPPAPDEPTGGEEQAIDALVAAGDTAGAVKGLFDLIVDHARRKNFARAEALRDKLMAIDDMALTEIVKSAEIIEEEKSAGLGGGMAELWQPLYDILTSEEINALFYAMDTVEFPTDAAILRQGQINDRLFFINQGKVKSLYRSDDTESVLKTYEKGDVVGVDSFFNIKVNTASLVAATPVTAMVLNRSKLAAWRDSHPGLEPKLVDHFLKQITEQELLKQAGVNRRRHPRIKLKGKLLAQILDARNTPLGKPFKGDLADLSVGGLSFFIKTSKKDTARMLLGRPLKLTFMLPGDESPLKVSRIGTVLSVNYLLQADYSLHIRFTAPLGEAEQASLNALAKG